MSNIPICFGSHIDSGFGSRCGYGCVVLKERHVLATTLRVQLSGSMLIPLKPQCRGAIHIRGRLYCFLHSNIRRTGRTIHILASCSLFTCGLGKYAVLWL
jgi:hypothetical protein